MSTASTLASAHRAPLAASSGWFKLPAKTIHHHAHSDAHASASNKKPLAHTVDPLLNVCDDVSLMDDVRASTLSLNDYSNRLTECASLVTISQHKSRFEIIEGGSAIEGGCAPSNSPPSDRGRAAAADAAAPIVKTVPIPSHTPAVKTSTFFPPKKNLPNVPMVARTLDQHNSFTASTATQRAEVSSDGGVRGGGASLDGEASLDVDNISSLMSDADVEIGTRAAASVAARGRGPANLFGMKPAASSSSAAAASAAAASSISTAPRTGLLAAKPTGMLTAPPGQEFSQLQPIPFAYDAEKRYRAMKSGNATLTNFDRMCLVDIQKRVDMIAELANSPKCKFNVAPLQIPALGSSKDTEVLDPMRGTVRKHTGMPDTQQLRFPFTTGVELTVQEKEIFKHQLISTQYINYWKPLLVMWVVDNEYTACTPMLEGLPFVQTCDVGDFLQDIALQEDVFCTDKVERKRYLDLVRSHDIGHLQIQRANMANDSMDACCKRFIVEDSHLDRSQLTPMDPMFQSGADRARKHAIVSTLRQTYGIQTTDSASMLETILMLLMDVYELMNHGSVRLQRLQAGESPCRGGNGLCDGARSSTGMPVGRKACSTNSAKFHEALRPFAKGLGPQVADHIVSTWGDFPSLMAAYNQLDTDEERDWLLFDTEITNVHNTPSVSESRVFGTVQSTLVAEPSFATKRKRQALHVAPLNVSIEFYRSLFNKPLPEDFGEPAARKKQRLADAKRAAAETAAAAAAALGRGAGEKGKKKTASKKKAGLEQMFLDQLLQTTPAAAETSGGASGARKRKQPAAAAAAASSAAAAAPMSAKGPISSFSYDDGDADDLVAW